MHAQTVRTPILARPLQRLGHRQLTQAHVALARAPELVQNGQQAWAGACAGLSKALGTKVEGDVALLESAWPAARSLSRAAIFVLFELSAIGAPGVLELESGALQAMLARLSGAPAAPAPVTSLSIIEEAAVGYLSLCALEGIRGVPLMEACLAPRLLGVTTVWRDAVGHLQPGTQVMLKAALTCEGQSGVARIILPSAPLATLAWLNESPQRRPLSPELQAATMALVVLAGHATLAAGEREHLSPGDVVLLGGLRREQGFLNGPGRLLGRSGVSLAGTFSSGAGFAVQRLQFTPPVDEDSPVSKTEMTITDVLPLQIEVELTRVQLTLGELSNVQPGYVLPLSIQPSGPVVLRIGGKPVAKAELVDVEGQVGARILSLVGTRAS